jgi:hypothetical protein
VNKKGGDMPNKKSDKSVEELIRQVFEDPGQNDRSLFTPGTPSNIFSVNTLPINHPLRERSKENFDKIFLAPDPPLETDDDKIMVERKNTSTKK